MRFWYKPSSVFPIFPAIKFGNKQFNGTIWRVVFNLRDPFGLHIVEGQRVDDRKADQKNVGSWIGQEAIS